jgi:hypothetical protein
LAGIGKFYPISFRGNNRKMGMKKMSDGCSDMADRRGSISNTGDHLPAVHINFATSTAKKCHSDPAERGTLHDFYMDIH